MRNNNSKHCPWLMFLLFSSLIYYFIHVQYGKRNAFSSEKWFLPLQVYVFKLTLAPLVPPMPRLPGFPGGPWKTSYSARSHWLLRGHMTSNNKTASHQKSLSGQQCKIYDVRGQQFTVTPECRPTTDDRRRCCRCTFFFLCYITNHLMTSPSGNS